MVQEAQSAKPLSLTVSDLHGDGVDFGVRRPDGECASDCSSMAGL